MLAGLHDQLDAEDRRPVADAARAAARRRGASRSRGRATTRRGLRRSVRAASAGASAVRRCGRRLDAVARRVAPRAPRADDRVVRERVRVDARASPPAARSRSRRRGSRRRPAPERRERGERVGAGSRRPSTARRAPRGRCRGGRPVPAPRASPWPSRCRGRGRPGASRRRRSPPGSPRARRRSASSMARPVLPVAVGPPRTMSGAGVRRSSGRVPRSGERPAERVRAGVLDADADELRRRASGEPATWTSLFSRDRPARCDDAVGKVRERVARLGGARRRPRRRGRGCAAATTVSTRTSVVAPDPRPVALEPDPLLERQQRVEAAALLGGRHVVGEPRGGRAGPLAVRRREDLVVADGLEQPERRLVLGVGLAAEPDDDVGREREPGDRLADRARAARGSARSCTGGPSGGASSRSPHWTGRWRASQTDGQSRIASISRSDRSHGCEVTNRRRGIAGAPSAVRSPSIGADELGEVRARACGPGAGPTVRSVTTCANRGSGGEVVAVGVDVLAEERDLAVAGRAEGPGLVDDLVERAAALRAAAERDDAVGARLVAAVDDRQPGADRASRGGRRRPRSRRPRARTRCVASRDPSALDGRRWPRVVRRRADRRLAPRRDRAGRRAPAPRRGAGTGPPPG